MSEFDPTDTDHLAGTHAVNRPQLYAAYADRIDQFMNGLEAAWTENMPAGAELAPATVMALTAIRSGLDLLGEITEGCRPPHIAKQMAEVTA
jgi:hypothetical protein